MRKTLKVAVFLIMATLIGFPLQAAPFTIDTVHSQVGFRIRHFVAKTRGSFDTFSGVVNFDASKASLIDASVVIKTASINTANENRDNHLKNPDFFNVEKFPEMTYKSTSVKMLEKGKWQITGDLTMLGVTKPIDLMVEGGDVVVDQKGNSRTGFSATGKLNRKDFGMVYNTAMDQGGFVLGDEVELFLEVEGVHSSPEMKEQKKKK